MAISSWGSLISTILKNVVIHCHDFKNLKPGFMRSEKESHLPHPLPSCAFLGSLPDISMQMLNFLFSPHTSSLCVVQ